MLRDNDHRKLMLTRRRKRSLRSTMPAIIGNVSPTPN
jgi:hypothetical protein